MNCSQARTMLAAYRELKNGQMDMTALEVHLSTCAACRALLAQSSLVGEQLRALPAIKPPADAHTKVMKALAAEHIRFIQNAAPSAQSTPIPGFLALYLKEHAQEVAHVDNIAAFSTADTGPLPLIQTASKRRKARRPFQMNSFAVVGLAAAFLMVIMLGGLTSLVILASRGVQGPDSRTTSIIPLSPLTLTNYTTATSYPHIVSAVADRQHIYYTAYRDTSNGWMLSALDNETKVSTPLLPKESASPLIALSSSEDWLIWLQLDQPKVVVNKNAHHGDSRHEVRTWSLQATYLGTDPATMLTPSTPVKLSKGTFDAATAPTWINTPVPGTWLTKDTLLAATIDEKGMAHLTRYELSAVKSPVTTELATVGNGHILTAPTGTSGGTSIYWSEEWMTADNMLHSTIWAQKTTPIAPPLHGRWTHQTTIDTYQLSTDNMLFRPQVVSDTLFLLNVKTPNVASMPQATPDATASSTPDGTVTASSQQSTGAMVRTNPAIYGLKPDEQLQGTLVTFSTLDDTPVPVALDNRGPVVAVQAGSRFILWQSSDKKIGMYDAVAREPVIVGANSIPNNIALLSVNGDTAVWTTNADSVATSTGATPDTGSTITFSTFNWPNKAPFATAP